MNSKKICYNCKKSSNNRKSTIKKKMPEWKKKIGLKTHFPNDKILPLKVKYPSKYNMTHILKLGKKFSNRYVYYYSANKKSIKDCLQPKFVVDAYSKNFNNMGVAKTNNDGIVKIKLDCPQSYYVNLNKLHTSHVHYFISDKNNKEWEEKLYTDIIICDLNKNELKNIIKNQCAVIINALPYEYYIKSHIPNSISIPYDIVVKNKITETEFKNYLTKMLVHYPRIYDLVKSKKLKLENVPIVSYCYKKQCDASTKLINKLLDFGFKDLKEYSEGILGWNKN